MIVLGNTKQFQHKAVLGEFDPIIIHIMVTSMSTTPMILFLTSHLISPVKILFSLIMTHTCLQSGIKL